MKQKNERKFARLKFVPLTIEIEHLRANILNNYNYFSTQKNSESSQLSGELQKLNINLDKLSNIKLDLETAARDCDYDENTPGNGFWSYVHNFNCAVQSVRKICWQLTKSRDKMLFNKKFYSKELELWNEIFESLIKICDVLLNIDKKTDKKCLYTSDNNWVTINNLMMSINQKAFYGCAVGFQCAKSVKPIVNILVSSLVGFSKFHFSDKHKSIRLLDFNVSTGKYFLKPKHRGHKFVASSQKGDIEFCKKFWFMTELDALHTLPNYLSHKVKVNKIFKIPAEPLETFSHKHQKFISIPLPHSHFETKPVSCRLLSVHRREGMVTKKSSLASSKSMPKSKHLLFHVHGGGWASQTSKSHEIYLKQWACHIKCPILSIDYSLTPMAPFPRAIEEIYYAYCWALNNFDRLGTTGEKIVFAGDSAGANLSTAILVKCIEEGIRSPDGIFNIYGIFNVDFLISPSSSLSIIDPMLPFSMTSSLIKSYGIDLNASDTGIDTNGNIIKENGSEKINNKFNFTFKKSYLLSPYQAPDEILKQFPRTIFLAAILDPLLDDSIEFGKKLKQMDVNVHVDVLAGLYHGFLYFIKFSKECRDASLMCADRIRELLEE